MAHTMLRGVNWGSINLNKLLAAGLSASMGMEIQIVSKKEKGGETYDASFSSFSAIHRCSLNYGLSEPSPSVVNQNPHMGPNPKIDTVVDFPSELPSIINQTCMVHHADQRAVTVQWEVECEIAFGFLLVLFLLKPVSFLLIAILLVSFLHLLERNVQPRQKVYIKQLNGISFDCLVDSSETGGSLKAKIQNQTRIPIQEQSLFYEGTPIGNENLLKVYKIADKSTLKLTRKLPGGKLFHVEVLGKNEKLTLELRDESKISDVKNAIYKKAGYDILSQNLLYGASTLGDDDSLKNCGISDFGVLYLILKNNIMNIAEEDLDPRYNFEYPQRDENEYSRGGLPLKRPCGWKKIAIKVLGKYGDDTWLGGNGRTEETASAAREWPVSYHGTSRKNAGPIVKEGFKLEKCRRFLRGKGIYSSPDPEVAEHFAKTFDYENENYKLIFMNRVNIEKTNQKDTPRGKYYITPDEKDIRPYAVLIKKLSK